MSSEIQGSYMHMMFPVMSYWVKKQILITKVDTPAELYEAMVGLKILRQIAAEWPADDIEQRYKQSLLTLVDDSILWVETRHGGGDSEAAYHEMQEAFDGVYIEAIRLRRFWRQRCFGTEE